MKYSRYMHYIICHGKQDAKVIFVGYNNQLSTKSVKLAMRSIKENLWKHLNGSKYANCIPAGRLSEQCREQRSSDKVSDQSPDTWLSGCPTSKFRCCFHSHIFALGVLDAPNVVVGNDRYLLVEVIVMVPLDAQLYMLCHSNSNTTVFDITRLPNSVGICKIACSPYILWLPVTLPRPYNQGKKYNMQTFQRMSRKRCISLQFIPGYHIGSQQILSSAIFAWRPIFLLTGCIQTLCIYTCHGEKVCQRLLQTNHTITHLVLQLVGHLPHQLPLLKFVSCKCKTGCSQCCGCRFIWIICTSIS